jgi:hypothetical protein
LGYEGRVPRRDSEDRPALALLRRRWPWALAAASALALGLPPAMMHLGRSSATACFERYERARGAARPDCTSALGWLALPARTPWTRERARDLAEEVQARAAIAAYTDAAVGSPDRGELTRGAARVATAAELVQAGSKRLRFEDLGPTIGAPDLGRYADDLGDRATLLARGEEWTEWSLRAHAMEAALIEGDVERAVALANRYADFDPRDQDLRATIAAVLCLGGRAERGLGLLGWIESERASERHEGWARDFGDVRRLIEVCAALAGKPPAPIPSEDAGRLDRPEALAALRLGLAPPGASPARDAVLARLERPLAEPSARAALLAEVLAQGYDGSPEAVARLARPLAGEAPLAVAWPLTVDVLLDEPREGRPLARLPALFDAVDALVRLASAPTAASDDVATLRQVAGALLLEAGTMLARLGRGADAEQAMRLGGELALEDPIERALARSSALYLADEPAEALARLEGVDLAAEKTGLARVVRAAALVQRAELLASLGRHTEATRAALDADVSAAAASDPEVSVHSQWTRLALARAATDALRDPPSRGASAPKLRWVGFADPLGRWARPDAPSRSALRETLQAWSQGVTSASAQQRALRYEALSQRGDAPSARTAYLAVAARIVPPTEGDTDLWLDAFDVIDARRVSLRARAFSRAEAARWRGDAKSAAAWRARFKALAALAADPRRAELVAFLKL